jgi:hypothetical protein
VSFMNNIWTIGSKSPVLSSQHSDLLHYVSLPSLLSCIRSENSHVALATQIFSAEQRRRADKARALHHSLLHPSDTCLMDALDSGVIIGTRLTKQDVKVYREIYGPCPFCLISYCTTPICTREPQSPLMYQYLIRYRRIIRLSPVQR